MPTMKAWTLLVGMALLAMACDPSTSTSDAAAPSDASGVRDVGSDAASRDAGVDAWEALDVGSDAGALDAGSDAWMRPIYCGNPHDCAAGQICGAAGLCTLGPCSATNACIFGYACQPDGTCQSAIPGACVSRADCTAARSASRAPTDAAVCVRPRATSASIARSVTRRSAAPTVRASSRAPAMPRAATASPATPRSASARARWRAARSPTTARAPRACASTAHAFRAAAVPRARHSETSGRRTDASRKRAGTSSARTTACRTSARLARSVCTTLAGSRAMHPIRACAPR